MKIYKIIFLACCPIWLYAQQISIAAFAGIATYQGDLQGSRFAINESKPAAGFSISHALSPKLSARVGYTMGKIQGDDKKNAAAKGVNTRNLNFASTIHEGQLALVYQLFNLEERSITPYIFAGVAAYHFNPYTYDVLGAKHYLQPLSTEGQGLQAYPLKKPYALNQLALPFGGGIKIAISDNTYMELELGLRKLFTDYLDDVSGNYADYNKLLAAKGTTAVTLAYRGNEIVNNAPYPAEGNQRGNPSSKDWYYFSGVRLSKTLQHNAGQRQNRKSRVGCPGVVW